MSILRRTSDGAELRWQRLFLPTAEYLAPIGGTTWYAKVTNVHRFDSVDDAIRRRDAEDVVIDKGWVYREYVGDPADCDGQGDAEAEEYVDDYDSEYEQEVEDE